MSKETAHRALFWVAGVESIAYAFGIWYALSGHYIPVDDHGAAEAVITTANVYGPLAIWSVLAVYLQIGLVAVDCSTASWGETVFDWVTSALPLASLIFTWRYMSDTTALVPWWGTFSGWIWGIVVARVFADCANLVRKTTKKWFL